MGYEAKVVLDSVCAMTGRRVITLSGTYWRSIHSELMTHRDRARNAASSRAIPWKASKKGGKPGELIPNCMYQMIQTEPFIPEYLGLEQKGMQSGDELEGEARANAIASIMKMRDFCLKEADYLASLNLHKSIVNRYVEPWMWITTLMTATEWANFFRLRCHPAAEKHFQKWSRMARKAIRESTPQVLHPGNWHLPYIQPQDHDAVEMWLRREGWEPVTADERSVAEGKMVDIHNLLIRKISAGRCARLSYLTHEGRRDIREDVKLANKLIYPKTAQLDDDVIHASPLEHVCRPTGDRHRSGPLIGYHQFRKDFPQENVEGVGSLED